MSINQSNCPQDVIVENFNNPKGREYDSWHWRSKNYKSEDMKFRARYQFKDCESAVEDAESYGHTVIEIRE